MSTATRNKLYRAYVEVRNGSISEETREFLLKLLDEEYDRNKDKEEEK